MKKRKCGKRLAAVLAITLLAGTLGACGKNGGSSIGASAPDSGGLPEPSKGRYVEQEEKLPQELEDYAIHQLFTVNGRLRLLASRQKDEKTCVLQEWERQEDGYADVTPGWLSAMEFHCGGWLEAKLAPGPDDICYLYVGYIQEGEDAFLAHLWKGMGETAEEITPEKWLLPNEEWGSYEMIQGIAALDNGTLAALSYSSLDTLSGEDGTIIESNALNSYYEGGIITDGRNLYLRSSGETGGMIERLADGKSQDAASIPYPAGGSSDGSFTIGGSGSLALAVLKDGTFIAACEDGIFRLIGGSADSQWEKLAEGIDTDFSISDRYCIDLAAEEDGSVYALFETENGLKLNRYTYDPDAVSEVTQVLKLYSVYESPLLKQAAILYHKAHPEVMVQIEYEYPMYSYETPDFDTVYKKLNTVLLGDDAPDLLVLDHLNMESYVSKGLLENLEDIVSPLEAKGELLSNITGIYSNDGKRYAVPLQFGFNMALGREIAPENMASMETLAAFLSQADYSYMGPRTTAELVNQFYPCFCAEIVKDKQLDKEVLGRYLDALKKIGDNCGILKSRPENETGYDMWNLGGEAKLAFDYVRGFSDCMAPMSMVKQIKGEYAAFENSFKPSAQAGICTKTAYPDTAKDFLLFALSEQVQDSEQYNGFPVNKASLEKQALKDRSNVTAVTMIPTDGGGYMQFEIEPYSQDTARKLVAICEALNKPVKEDAKIQEVLTECLGEFLEGSESKETAVQKIEDGLKMYLAE